MKKRWIFRGAKIAVFAVVGILVLGWVVTSLWNWLMPGIFGLGAITFWQALGLLLLSRVLFGSFRGGPRGMRRGMGRRWARMTPEERERFRKGIEGRCARPETAV
jgi:hypothetical protein